jgi:peptide/nickel transport system permease protein
LAIPGHLDEFNPDARLKAPSAGHPLGTDTAGRDLLVRIMLGSRISLLAAAVIVTLAAFAGGVVGIVSGYLGGRGDEVIMRGADVFLSVPPLVLAIAVATILGPSIYTAMMGLALAWWPVYARLMRAEVLAVSRTLYVEAALALGANGLRIMARHLLPNAVAPILVQASLDFGHAILYNSALSFLGLGAQPPSPEWGALISASRNHLREAWWFTTFPGLAIFVSVMAFNFFGDVVRDLLDPRTRVGT